MKKHLLFFLFCIGAIEVSLAQDIIIMDGFSVPPPTCDAIFSDSGFLVGDYGDDQDITVTICSDNGEGIQIEFAEFDVEDGIDFLTVYDGPDDSSPQIAGSPFTGSTINTLISSGTCLTFNFQSDASGTGSGWAGALSCVPIGPPVDCLIDSEFAIFPPYEPGDGCLGGNTYNYCFTINDWAGDSPNEFHGFEILLGSGVDAATLVPVSTPASCDGLGTWGFYPSVTSAGTGLVSGPGFYYDADGDGDPGNNAGDACAGALPWTFCFDVTMDACLPDASNNGEDASIVINTLSDGESGAFNDPTCTTDDVITIEGALACAPPCPGNCVLCPPGAFFTNFGPLTLCPSDPPLTSLDIQVIGFIGSYTITYDYGAGPVTVNSFMPNISIPIDLPFGGTVSLISITDDLCADIPLGDSFEIIVIEAPDITFDADGVICPGEDVDLNLTFSNLFGVSSPPYMVTYTIDGGPGGTFTANDFFHTLTVSGPGVYELISIEANGCVFDLAGPSVTLTLEVPSEATLSGDTVICQGEFAELELLLEGTPPFDVTLELNGFFYDMITYFAEGPQIYFTADGGEYIISDVSNPQCDAIISGSATVEFFDQSTVTLSGGGIYCDGQDADLLIECEGTPPWTVTYAINGVAQTPLDILGSPFTLLTPLSGFYTIFSAVDGNGCAAATDGNANVIFNPPPTADISGDISLCEGDVGFLDLLLTGGAPLYLNYEIDGVLQEEDTIFFDTGQLEVTQGGAYTLVSIANETCEGVVSGAGTVQIINAPTATITGIDSVCTGTEVDLEIALTGTPDFVIDIFLDGIFHETLITSDMLDTLTAITAGEYTIGQLNDANCVNFDVDTFSIGNFPPPIIDVSNDTILCFNDSLTIGGSATDGFGGPYAYQWVVGIDTLATDSIDIVALGNDGYEFLVDDGCGVLYSQTVVLGVHPFPAFDTTDFDLGLCGQGTLALDTELPLSLYGDSCVWTINGTTFSVCDSIDVPLNIPGSYDVDLFVLTQQGCIFDSTLTGLIDVNEVPIAGFTYTPAQPTIVEDLLAFQDYSFGATMYNWFLDTLLFSNLPTPTLDLPDTDVGRNYTICLAVANDFGCTDTLCQVVKVDGDLIVHVPTAFTPDDDLVNDSWAPVVVGAMEEEYNLKVFGRNGQIIWETDDINERWIGQGADDLSYYAGDSVYQWLLEVRRLGSVDKRTYQGIVTLVR